MKASAPALSNAQLCAALVCIVALVYWPTSRALWIYWTDPEGMGNHGLLVAAIAAWLLFRSRRPLNQAAAFPTLWLVIPLILMSLAWLVFWRAHIPALHIILFPALMVVSITATLGWKAARWVVFPIGFLYFAVPSWDVVVTPLQSLTVMVTGAVAPLVGIPGHVEGDLFLTSVGTFEIGRGCSGVNFFAIGLAVAALLGELENASALRRFTLLCIMGIAAIVSNWIRVLIIVDAGYTTNMRHVLVSRSHYMFGWVLFSIVMFAFVWLCSRAPRAPDAGGGTSVAATGPGSPGLLAHAAVMLSLIAVPVLAYGLGGTAEAAVAPFAFHAPGGTGDWRGPVVEEQHFIYQAATGDSVELTALTSGMHGPDKDLAAVLAAATERIAGKSQAGAGKSPVGTSGTGDPTLSASRTVMVDGLPYTEAATTDSKGRALLLWFKYDFGGRRFVTPLLSRLWYGVASLGGGARPVLFAFWASCNTSCDSARHNLTDFAKTLGPQLSQASTRVSQSPSKQRSL